MKVKKTISMHTRSDLWRDVKEIAEANNTTVGRYVNFLISEDVERFRKQQQRKTMLEARRV